MDMIQNSLQKFLSKVVISEAVPENVELKKSVFSEVDSLAPSHTIIASNASTISITELASAQTFH